MLGMAATIVIMIGAVVVTGHVAGQLQADADLRVATLSQSVR